MRKPIAHLTIWFIVLLIAASVYSAFLGAERAQRFFNSLPLAVYWAFGVVLIIVSVAAFRKLHKPHLFLMHAGTLLIILGSMWGSEKGHELRSRYLKHQKPTRSRMVIDEGQTSNELFQDSGDAGMVLPFGIRLNDFVVEYYPSMVYVNFPDGARAELPAQPGAGMTFEGRSVKKIQVTGVFENFRLTFENGQRNPIDSPEAGRNPAVELAITGQDDRVRRQFVFELFPGHASESGLQFTYYRPIKDYISRVDVIRDGAVVKSAGLEVNHPLHYGGYHFYQYSYDDKEHRYTVLQVVSDDGLYVVYAGFVLLCAGTVWYFWFTQLRRLWR
jgi:hypothetical protein